MSFYCENCEERGETTEREVDRLREVVERDRARIAELERGEILADKELMSAIITAVMSSVQSDRDDALRKVQRHIIRVEKDLDDLETQCEHMADYRALAEQRVVELGAEVKRLIEQRDGPLYRCPQCDHLRLELGDARAEAEALRHDMERQADTLAELATENEALRKALAMMYDKWVDGDDCYEEPDTFSAFLGKAFQLSITEEDHVISLLGKDCPTRAIDAAIAKEQKP